MKLRKIATFARALIEISETRVKMIGAHCKLSRIRDFTQNKGC